MNPKPPFQTLSDMLCGKVDFDLLRKPSKPLAPRQNFPRMPACVVSAFIPAAARPAFDAVYLPGLARREHHMTSADSALPAICFLPFEAMTVDSFPVVVLPALSIPPI